MTTENPKTNRTKICPTCGTRVNEDAPRCLVCGTSFASTKTSSTKPVPEPEIRGRGMPTLTISAPVILIMLVIFIGVGGGLTYFALSASNIIPETTPIGTDTSTPTPSLTPTEALPTPTWTPQPSPTPLSYQVQDSDTCGGIAFAFNVSVQSIIIENNLSADCILSIGTVLFIPHPTPTVTPEATNTPSSQQATIEACQKDFHVVQENETLSIIALIYEVPIEYIMEWSGKTVDTAFFGETLTIPLCLRNTVAGSTVTPSLAPAYAAPELLLPRNGEAFTLDDDTVTLQWASIGELRENEFYLISVVDVTAGQNTELIASVKDTKFIVPTSLRPSETIPHIFKWSVVAVAQIGVDEDGNAIYRDAGPRSESTYFSWVGTPPQTPQP